MQILLRASLEIGRSPQFNSLGKRSIKIILALPPLLIGSQETSPPSGRTRGGRRRRRRRNVDAPRKIGNRDGSRPTGMHGIVRDGRASRAHFIRGFNIRILSFMAGLASSKSSHLRGFFRYFSCTRRELQSLGPGFHRFPATDENRTFLQFASQRSFEGFARKMLEFLPSRLGRVLERSLRFLPRSRTEVDREGMPLARLLSTLLVTSETRNGRIRN